MSRREDYSIDVIHGELTDVVLPKRMGPSSHADRVERQFDHLIDLLAVDQFLDSHPTDIATSNQTASVSDVAARIAPQPNPAVAETPVKYVPVDVSSKPAQLELSVVIPCLDEADTVGACVLKALDAIAKLGIPAEVIVADNGSRDQSIQIAEELGARVVHVEERGYGAALMGGIESAKGRFIIMGDADDSYDFGQLPRFYERLLEGADLVQGCRLASGGGMVLPGAMPLLHRFGNPALSWLVRRMFKAPVHDVYCGMRGFRRDLYTRLDQRCTGMEFATEMIIKSTLFGARISEIPIVLHPDGRRSHRPHLRTFRDGWKTLRFFLLQSPRWLFLAPAFAMAMIALLGYAMVYSPFKVANIAWDAHTLLVATLSALVAVQVASCGVLARVFAGFEGLLPLDERIEKISHSITLERCLMLSAALIVTGAGVIFWQANRWVSGGFGTLEYSQTMRFIIPAVGAIAMGVQIASSSFLLSVLRLRRR
jgi:glycosyltransferase involved in cell wall biosynthesis